MKNWIVLAAIAGAVGVIGYWASSGRSDASRQEAAARAIIVPALSADARFGESAFKIRCVACHGKNASGTDKGPPLIHKFYEPNHHADGAFFFAAKRGVVQHHWKFGNMPPIPDIREDEIASITRYVREIQKANGIF